MRHFIFLHKGNYQLTTLQVLIWSRLNINWIASNKSLVRVSVMATVTLAYQVDKKLTSERRLPVTSHLRLRKRIRLMKVFKNWYHFQLRDLRSEKYPSISSTVNVCHELSATRQKAAAAKPHCFVEWEDVPQSDTTGRYVHKASRAVSPNK
jgi:hypothetical protein